MKKTSVQSKLFLISGALCSGLAFVMVFLLDTPVTKNLIIDYNNKQVAAIANSNNIEPKLITASEYAALAVLSSEDILKSAGHIPTDKEVIADLAMNKITVLKGPSVIAEYPILSIGKPGTFWETPAGDYSIKTKEEKHLSSIGGTWMPYSMQFYGNFFVHGWPTYDDGTDVPKGYSGGCIRLSTDDAEELFKTVDIGTHIHVRGSNASSSSTDSSFYMKEVNTPPKVNAKSFAVFDVDTEKVLWSSNIESFAEPKKLTSILTALVSVETIDQYKYVNFEALLRGKNPGNAKASDPSSVQVGALLYPLLFDQSDIAARAIVELRGKKVFRDYMNEKALAIGMASTSFGGGTSEDTSTTTARDLSRLLVYLDKQKSYLLKTTLATTRSFEVDGEKRFSWKNKNDWINDGTFQGGVISKNAAGKGSAIAIYSLPMSEFGSRRIGFVVIDAENINDELNKIKDYASNNFFYGSDISMQGNIAGATDLDSKAIQLKKIKEQLIN